MNRSFCVGVLSLALVGWITANAFGDDKGDPAAKSQQAEKKAEPAKAGGEVEKAAGIAKAAEAREVRVTLDDLPSPVRRTLARESYGGEVKEVERETKAGKTTFEADVKLDGSTYEVVISAEGKLLSKTLDDDDDGDDDDDDDDEDDDDEDDDDDDAAKNVAAKVPAAAVKK